jgi:hypothetical protein
MKSHNEIVLISVQDVDGFFNAASLKVKRRKKDVTP